ncbi:hypothetical protein [Paraliomyxa miuraensis]|uniref:hypothetical protein n=1 Tax=Paraliomyxa miuraensis TaxID=376150 RepID=UPI00224EE3A2|nr:hypothetical protein [Paraliomyxa miuraensis]MCX4240103.1 hypothetical protein [Paraliomyxa miuraensis]
MRSQARPAARVGQDRRLRSALVALALPLGCQLAPPPASVPPSRANSAAPDDQRAADPPAPRPPKKDPTPAKGWLDGATAQAEADRILAEISATRNLPVTAPVNVDVVDKPGIRTFAQRSMYEHVTREEIQLMGRIQASLGVMPRDVDPEQVILDLLEDGVAGFYDPKEKTLFIGDFVDKGTLSMVVGHEIAHGLQDMHFDLNKHQEPLRHRSDEESARRFLIEGEAQATYLAWVSRGGGLSSIDDAVLDAMGNQVLDLAAMTSTYPVLVRSLQLPYADGTATVTRLVRDKGWEAVDALYADLPRSSEQMLHLDKLLAREAPIPTRLDAAGLLAMQPGTTVVWHDTLGEAELLAMLADAQRSTVARRAAAGWGGDHYVAMEWGGDRQGTNGLGVPLVVGVTVWDTEDDAEEFEEVFGEYLDAAVPDHAIDRRNDMVLFATGIPAQVDANKLVSTAWKGVHVDRDRKGKRRRQRKGHDPS